MNILEKIEAIRRQPEHVRVRYVWMCVAVSMFIILILWFFSIASMFAEEKNNPDQQNTGIVPDMQQQLQTIKEQAPSLQDISNQPLTVDGEGTAANTQTTGNASDLAAPSSNTYSNLPNANLAQ
jgi:hypothetical protein